MDGGEIGKHKAESPGKILRMPGSGCKGGSRRAEREWLPIGGNKSKVTKDTMNHNGHDVSAFPPRILCVLAS